MPGPNGAGVPVQPGREPEGPRGSLSTAVRAVPGESDPYGEPDEDSGKDEERGVGDSRTGITDESDDSGDEKAHGGDQVHQP